MQTVQQKPPVEIAKQAGRRVGYALAIGINIVMLWVVYNVLDWGWPPFITEDWSRVRGLIALSMIVAILANLAFMAYDPKWFRGFGDATQGVFAVIASARVLAVFPFDYSAYTGPWEFLTRAVLIIAVIGTGIGIIANIAKGIRHI